MFVKMNVNNGKLVYTESLPTTAITTSESYVIGTTSTGNHNTIHWANTSAYANIGYFETSDSICAV